MRNVLILGAGISGLGAAHVLLKHGVSVLISDLKDTIQDKKEKEALSERGAVFVFGTQTESLLDGIDTVVVSPVIPAENPIVAAAVKKTTTTTLLGSMISHSGKPFALAGNLGISMSREAELVPSDGLIAAEVSSFQLEFIESFKPKAAVILNITPDHLERHHTMEAYIAAKARIFENMDQSDCLLLNAESPLVYGLKDEAEKHTHVCLLSTKHEVEEGAFMDGNTLVIRRNGKDIRLCSSDNLKLKGAQNMEDCLAAAFLANEGGVSPEVIISSLKSFEPLPNRIEFVRTINEVSYYNDSKATNTDAAIKGMEAFSKPVILIAGGYDKGTDLTEFMDVVKTHVKELILLGAAADRFEKAAAEAGVSKASIHRADSMADAVKQGQKFAKPGDIVILSPACSSFDMYHNMEERGMDFKRIVNSLA